MGKFLWFSSLLATCVSLKAAVLLNNIPWGTYGVDYNPWTNPVMGQQFTTDNKAYTLDSVTLTLSDLNATAAGGFSVAVFSSIGAGPSADYGAKIGDLVAQGAFFNALSNIGWDNPTDVTFNASNISLNANTAYWIKVTNPNSYAWLNVYGGPFPNFGTVDTGQGGKAMANPFTLTVNVTAVPEPTTGFLLSAGLVISAVSRRRFR
jgi:hypothetical protein